MKQLDEIEAHVKKIKCPICRKRMKNPTNNFYDSAHFIDKNDKTIYSAETWCSDDPQHYRMCFEWIDNSPWKLIIEDLLLFDDEYEYTIERYLIGKKIVITLKPIFNGEDWTNLEYDDPGISLRKFNIKKLYTLLTFK